MTCANVMWELIYMYCKKARLVYQSTAVGAVLKSKVIIWHPLSENILHGNLLWKFIGDVYGGALQNRVHGQSRSTVPRSPGSGILVPCGNSQIFVAAQVWHGMLQALVLGHSLEQLAWQEQLEPVSSGLLVVQVQQVWAACMVQVGVMQVVLLRSRVLIEPAVWQWCHLEQCQLLWHCVHRGISMHGIMWNHCWCILDSCSMVGCISQ